MIEHNYKILKMDKRNGSTENSVSPKSSKNNSFIKLNKQQIAFGVLASSKGHIKTKKNMGRLYEEHSITEEAEPTSSQINIRRH